MGLNSADPPLPTAVFGGPTGSVHPSDPGLVEISGRSNIAGWVGLDTAVGGTYMRGGGVFALSRSQVFHSIFVAGPMCLFNRTCQLSNSNVVQLVFCILLC